MPTWGQILAEIQGEIVKKNPQAFDQIRIKYLKELSEKTNRPVIVYAAKWTTGDAPQHLVSINDEDIQGFMEAIYGIQGYQLDLILHTGGGSAEATDAIVSYLRQKFKFIRVIIPQAAMSAGTMLACAADEILMGKHSSIGPIDPQFILHTQLGIQAIPAHSILDQFQKAQEECAADPRKINSWLPILSQYGPALLVRCQNQIDFSRELVENWLKLYMFKADENSANPIKAANYLANHNNFKTHGKHLNIQDAKQAGLKVSELEEDQDLQGRVLSAFHATMHTLTNTNVCKIISNHIGNSFIKQYQIPQFKR